jgi:hypothetical protein
MRSSSAVSGISSVIVIDCSVFVHAPYVGTKEIKGYDRDHASQSVIQFKI